MPFSTNIDHSRTPQMPSRKDITRLRRAFDEADAVVVGAGAGLSIAAGLAYDGDRFERLFAPWRLQYGFTDMYAGGFYPYDTLEEFWAFWCVSIIENRYVAPPRPVYEQLVLLLEGRDYFVITTNVDHCFQRAGIDKHRLFYTQGDYGLFQCSRPCHDKTYDNEKQVRAMHAALMESISEQRRRGVVDAELDLRITSDLVPRCPECGAPMTTNLRCDNTFVQDEGWHTAAMRYSEFVQRHEGLRTLFLELGVGYNTPVIIKYPFWQMTAANLQATYACINAGQTDAPPEIASQSILIDADVADVIDALIV